MYEGHFHKFDKYFRLIDRYEQLDALPRIGVA